MRDDITYLFPNVNGCLAEVWEWISNFTQHFMMDVITYLSNFKDALDLSFVLPSAFMQAVQFSLPLLSYKPPTAMETGHGSQLRAVW